MQMNLANGAVQPKRRIGQILKSKVLCRRAVTLVVIQIERVLCQLFVILGLESALTVIMSSLQCRIEGNVRNVD